MKTRSGERLPAGSELALSSPQMSVAETIAKFLEQSSPTLTSLYHLFAVAETQIRREALAETAQRIHGLTAEQGELDKLIAAGMLDWEKQSMELQSDELVKARDAYKLTAGSRRSRLETIDIERKMLDEQGNKLEGDVATGRVILDNVVKLDKRGKDLVLSQPLLDFFTLAVAASRGKTIPEAPQDLDDFLRDGHQTVLATGRQILPEAPDARRRVSIVRPGRETKTEGEEKLHLGVNSILAEFGIDPDDPRLPRRNHLTKSLITLVKDEDGLNAEPTLANQEWVLREIVSRRTDEEFLAGRGPLLKLFQVVKEMVPEPEVIKTMDELREAVSTPAPIHIEEGEGGETTVSLTAAGQQLEFSALAAALSFDRNGVWQAADPKELAIEIGGKIQGPKGQKMGNTRRKIIDAQKSSLEALQRDIDEATRLAQRAGANTVGEFLEHYNIDPELRAKLVHAPELKVSALKYIVGAIELPSQAGAIKPRTAKELVNFLEKKSSDK